MYKTVTFSDNIEIFYFEKYLDKTLFERETHLKSISPNILYFKKIELIFFFRKE